MGFTWGVEDNLKVKEVKLDDTRYIICYNPYEAEKDKFDQDNGTCLPGYKGYFQDTPGLSLDIFIKIVSRSIF